MASPMLWGHYHRPVMPSPPVNLLSLRCHRRSLIPVRLLSPLSLLLHYYLLHALMFNNATNLFFTSLGYHERLATPRLASIEYHGHNFIPFHYHHQYYQYHYYYRSLSLLVDHLLSSLSNNIAFEYQCFIVNNIFCRLSSALVLTAQLLKALGAQRAGAAQQARRRRREKAL